MRFFRRRKSVVERIEAWTGRPTANVQYQKKCMECGTSVWSRSLDVTEHWADEHQCREHTINVSLPLTVDGALLATQIEQQFKRRAGDGARY